MPSFIEYLNECVTDKEIEDFYNSLDEDASMQIKSEYSKLMKLDIKNLRDMLKKSDAKVDPSRIVSKQQAVHHYLKSKHGDKKVNSAFGIYEETSEQLDEVDASEKRSFMRQQHQAEWEREKQLHDKKKAISKKPHNIYIGGTEDKHVWKDKDGKPKVFNNHDHAMNVAKKIATKDKRVWVAPHKGSTNESVDLVEISQETLSSYTKKAERDKDISSTLKDKSDAKGDKRGSDYWEDQKKRRERGIAAAVKKSKEKAVKEANEYLDEESKTLKHAIKEPIPVKVGGEAGYKIKATRKNKNSVSVHLMDKHGQKVKLTGDIGHDKPIKDYIDHANSVYRFSTKKKIELHEEVGVDEKPATTRADYKVNKKGKKYPAGYITFNNGKEKEVTEEVQELIESPLVIKMSTAPEQVSAMVKDYLTKHNDLDSIAKILASIEKKAKQSQNKNSVVIESVESTDYLSAREFPKKYHILDKKTDSGRSITVTHKLGREGMTEVDIDNFKEYLEVKYDLDAKDYKIKQPSKNILQATVMSKRGN